MSSGSRHRHGKRERDKKNQSNFRFLSELMWGNGVRRSGEYEAEERKKIFITADQFPPQILERVRNKKKVFLSVGYAFLATKYLSFFVILQGKLLSAALGFKIPVHISTWDKKNMQPNIRRNYELPNGKTTAGEGFLNLFFAQLKSSWNSGYFFVYIIHHCTAKMQPIFFYSKKLRSNG